MKSNIDTLVAMRDSETLFELMNGDDEITQFDAAEGLLRLGDVRALEFLQLSALSEIEEVSEMAEEMLASDESQRLMGQLEAEHKQARLEKVKNAHLRLQKGKKVYTYKMLFIPANAILQDNSIDRVFSLPELDEAGLEGWEVVNLLPRRRNLLVNSAEEHFTGVYLLLKREIAPDEAALLETD
jgi:hypothetical protein